MDTNNQILLSRSQCASALGNTPGAIKNWESSRGFSECYDGNKINVLKALKWMYKWKCELEEDKTESSGSEVKKYWDGKKAEVQYKLMTEELVPKTEYIQAEKERLSIIRQHIMVIPDTLAPELNLNQIQKTLVVQTCKSILESIKSTFKGKTKEWIEIINGKMPSEQKDDNGK